MSVSSTMDLLVAMSNRAWRILIVLALLAVALIGAVALAAVVVPVLLAAVVVPAGRPLFLRFDRRLPTSVAAAAVILVVAAAVGVAGLVMVWSLAANWPELWSGVAEAVSVIVDWFDDRFSGLGEGQLRDAETDLRSLTASIADTLIGGVASGLGTLSSLLIGVALFLMTLFFGVRDWDKFRSWVLSNVAAESQPRVSLFFDRYSSVLRGYWLAQAYVGLFDAAAIGIGLWLIGVPLAAPIAVLTFFISFIPYVGALASGSIAVLVALGSGGGGDAAIVLLLSLFIFNSGENLVRPWLVKETVHIHTFVAFIAGMTGVLVAGALGAIVAIPVVVLIGEARRILTEDDPVSRPSL